MNAMRKLSWGGMLVGTLALAQASAFAADLERRDGFTVYRGENFGVRAGAIYVYEDEAGSYVREYWRAPWQNRRYFPTAGEAPGYGRVEVIPPANRRLPPPAESYFRYWSSPPGYDQEIQARPPLLLEQKPDLPPGK